MSKVLWCDLCKVQLSSQALLDDHCRGKRHQKKALERNALTALASRSVFISGLNPEIDVGEEEIVEALSCFGKVEKVHLDNKKKTFAIVEFDKEFSAHCCIFEDKVRIGYQVVTVRARKVDFDHCQSRLKEQSIDVKKIIERISKQRTFVSQVDALLTEYCLTDSQIIERTGYAQVLTDALREYFSSGALVRIFGSSITSIGTKDSDIDASLFFDVPLNEQQCPGDLARNKYTLLTCDMNALRGRKICAEEYGRLSLADRVRLLNKVMNDIRKRCTAPVTGQYPILDARCPLVRFIFKRNQQVDLSVENHLGYAKSNWIKSIVQSDSSLFIRRFLIAVRFWTHANELMRTNETEKSHFNAYILNLLCITYLQIQNHVIPFRHSSRELLADGWRIDFVVENVDLSFILLNKLFREFFIWFVQLKLKDAVLCPKLGCIISVDQFRHLYPDVQVQDVFKLAHLNIQDPIELSHNVSMLVSEKHIAAMRRQMMFALSHMKTVPDSFVAILHGDSGPASSASLHDRSVIIRTRNCNLEQCLEAAHRIFVDVLAFTPCVEPFDKRPRLVDEELQRVYIAKQRTWESRRNKRRQLKREKPNLACHAIELEKAVTSQICQSSEELTLCFKVFVNLYNGGVIFDLVLLNGPDSEFVNLVHFLQYFLPSIFKYAMLNNSGEMMEQ